MNFFKKFRTNAKRQDKNFKIKLLTNAKQQSNNYKIIIDINIILCYNIIEDEGRKIKPLARIKLKHKGEKLWIAKL